jgi:hypothetical protein
VRNWFDKKHNFEVIVGKSVLSVSADEEAKSPSTKRLGFVQTLDTQSKRRLYELLQSQGLQMNQEITFLSDGDDKLQNLQLEMSPKATHILGWFHLTMKLTVLGQFGKGLVHCEAVLGEEIGNQIERLKWSLWHGQVDKALSKIDDLETSIEPFSETYACVFRSKVATDSGRNLPPIPVEGCHRFRLKAASHSSRNLPPQSGVLEHHATQI